MGLLFLVGTSAVVTPKARRLLAELEQKPPKHRSHRSISWNRRALDPARAGGELKVGEAPKPRG